MAIDTPARIAILGGGPIALETALYARFLGYDVDIYERGRACENVRSWAHVRLVTPFAWNASPLGVAALKAQDPSWKIPAADALLTGQEFLDQYLLPLATSDLVEDCLRENTEVLAVAKTDSSKGVLYESEDRGDENFRVLLRGQDGRETYAEADVVIDCTGLARAQHLGAGGLPAIGELAHASFIEYATPDIAGADRARFADRRILIVGSAPGAPFHVVELVKLQTRYPNTQVTWLTRTGLSGALPVEVPPESPLPAATQIAAAANEAVGSGRVKWLDGAAVYSLQPQADGGLTVKTIGDVETEFSVDRVLACVGPAPDVALWEELHVTCCPATQSPLANGLLTAEPNFYVLGAKSFGRKPGFALLEGLRQVRALFKIIGDRDTLDLYQTVGGVKL